jgi:hypothetical protein
VRLGARERHLRELCASILARFHDAPLSKPTFELMASGGSLPLGTPVELEVIFEVAAS